MKKLFKEPNVSIIELSKEDVICSSDDPLMEPKEETTEDM